MIPILKVFKSNAKQLKNFSFLILVNIISAALGWATQIKIANTLGRELFGQIAFGIVLGTFGQVFIRFGLDRTLVRDLIHHPDRFADIVRASIYLRYIIAAICFTMFFIWIFFNKSSDISCGVILIFIASSIKSLDLQSVYDAIHKIQQHATFFLLQRFLYLLAIWSIIIWYPKELTDFTIGLALMITTLLYLIVQHRWAINHIATDNTNKHNLIKDIKWLATNNWLVWLASICTLLAVMLNQPILKHYAGYAELGGYSAATQIMMVGTLFIDQVSRIGRPMIARYTVRDITQNGTIKFLIKYLATISGVALPLVLIMICFPNYIFHLLFKPEYMIAAKTLPILGFYLLLYSFGVVSSQYILSIGREKIYFLSTIIGGLLSIFLCYTIIPEYRSIGAAWVMLISHGITMIIYCIAMIYYVRQAR